MPESCEWCTLLSCMSAVVMHASGGDFPFGLVCL